MRRNNLLYSGLPTDFFFHWYCNFPPFDNAIWARLQGDMAVCMVAILLNPMWRASHEITCHDIKHLFRCLLQNFTRCWFYTDVAACKNLHAPANVEVKVSILHKIPYFHPSPHSWALPSFFSCLSNTLKHMAHKDLVQSYNYNFSNPLLT